VLPGAVQLVENESYKVLLRSGDVESLLRPPRPIYVLQGGAFRHTDGQHRAQLQLETEPSKAPCR
jgi:hypothetical protein